MKSYCNIASLLHANLKCKMRIVN